MSNSDPLILLLAVALLVGLIVLPVAIKWFQGSLTIFEPVTVLATGFLLYFVVGPVFQLLTHQTEALGRDFQPVYLIGFLGVGASVLCMWLGYSLPMGRHAGGWIASRLCVGSPGDGAPMQRHFMGKSGWTLVIGGSLGLVLALVLGSGSLRSVFLPGVLSPSSPAAAEDPNGLELNYLFSMIEWFISGYLFLMCARAFRLRWIAFALLAYILMIYVSLGVSFRIVLFLLAIVTLRYLSGSSRAQPVAVWLILGPVILLAVGYVHAARGFFNSGGTSGSATPSTAAVLEASWGDTGIFQAYAAVLAAVPVKVSYAGLAPVEYVFVQPIPRVLWPAKPPPRHLQKIAEAIGTPAAPTAGAFVPNFGEYYLAFGWLGVVGGMMAFGVAARMLWEFWVASDGDRFALVIYACSLPFLLQVVSRGYSAQIVQEWFFIIFPAVFVARRARHHVLVQATA